MVYAYVIMFTLALCVFLAYLIRYWSNMSETKEKSFATPAANASEASPPCKPEKNGAPKQTKTITKGNVTKAVAYSHPWLLSSLKGHTSDVLDFDFAPDGKRFISVSEDRKALLWDARDFMSNEHKSVQSRFEYDCASRVAFAPDSCSVLLAFQDKNVLSVYRRVKNEVGKVRLVPVENVEYPKVHQQDIEYIGFSATGKFIFSACKQGKAFVYSLKGEILATLKFDLGALYHCALSPDGRFISACGFSPDVIVQEIQFDREGKFKAVKKVFALTGAVSGVYSCVFNADSSRAVTVSKDAFIRVYNTGVEYNFGEDPHLIAKKECPDLRTASPEQISLSISPSGGSFALIISQKMKFFCADNLELELVEADDLSRVTRVRHSPCGEMVVVSGDRVIRIFRNIAEYYSQVERLRKSIPLASNASAKRRIEEQVDEFERKILQFPV